MPQCLCLCYGVEAEENLLFERAFTKRDRMRNQSTKEAGFDAALPHGLARLALGLNIAMHGYSRLPNLAGFANGMVKQFSATFLPSPLVYITGITIATGEAIIGTLLFWGCSFGQLLLLVHC